MHEWSLSDRRRHKELIEQCREERKRTRRLMERSRQLSAGNVSPYAGSDKKNGESPSHPTPQ